MHKPIVTQHATLHCAALMPNNNNSNNNTLINPIYFVAGGLPNEHPNHTKAMAMLAISMLHEIELFNKAHGFELALRIGRFYKQFTLFSSACAYLRSYLACKNILAHPYHLSRHSCVLTCSALACNSYLRHLSLVCSNSLFNRNKRRGVCGRRYRNQEIYL